MQAKCRALPKVVQVSYRHDLWITQWHLEQVEVDRLGTAMGSQSFSLLVSGEDAICPNSIWLSLMSVCSKSTVVNVVSDVLYSCPGLCIRDVLWRRRLYRLPCCGCIGSHFRICCTGSDNLMTGRQLGHRWSLARRYCLSIVMVMSLHLW